MMTDTSAQAFRDYATRISFNLSLSRNQVGHLAGVVAEIENAAFRVYHDVTDRQQTRQDAVVEAGANPALFVVGRGSLQRMGLILPDPEWEAIRDKPGWTKYVGPTYRLTPAGEHVVELLRIAGLIPRAAANLNSKRKAKAA